jgi:hypothetical protein
MINFHKDLVSLSLADVRSAHDNCKELRQDMIDGEGVLDWVDKVDLIRALLENILLRHNVNPDNF